MARSAAVAETLGCLVREAEAVVDLVLDRVAAEIPSYARVPRALLRPGVAASVRDGIAFLMDGEGRGLDAAAAGADRAARGIPVEDVLRAYRVGVRTVWERFAGEARRRSADPDEILALAERVWEWADDVMVRAAREHRRVELETALDAQRRRGAFIRAVLSGTQSPESLPAQAAAFGLDPDRAYVPFRARGPGDARAIVTALVPYLPHTAPPVTLLDGDVAGLLARRPAALPEGVVVGVGPAVRPAAARPAFEQASRALDAAARFGLTGVHDLAGLGLRAAVVAEREVGALLHERYLAPLRALPDIERTLVAYLAGGMHVEDTARALYVHPNTLRNRLRRFEELTGADLRDHGTLAELWWALAYQGVITQGAPPHTSTT
ncbi:PucR family transcriptional regulator [Actinomadura parmotrematis]|uniref:Helix-turn-helix domain-containing protein n=1 Tax=Actinomadura parmotrematis TaxID=2864039 RepID=A0ABS7FK72_9ACTN|nr:PucR family transcriptional regulator [Actinomadura parmotrematis]MBW8480746.1 helix-turn-helix domain-containing protein [Actinomadura parmotrematis]